MTKPSRSLSSRRDRRTGNQSAAPAPAIRTIETMKRWRRGLLVDRRDADRWQHGKAEHHQEQAEDALNGAKLHGLSSSPVRHQPSVVDGSAPDTPGDTAGRDPDRRLPNAGAGRHRGVPEAARSGGELRRRPSLTRARPWPVRRANGAAVPFRAVRREHCVAESRHSERERSSRLRGT